jgi:phage shock protein A
VPNGDRHADCPNLIQLAQDAVRQIKEANDTIHGLHDKVRLLQVENDALRRAIRSLKENPPNAKR